MKIVKNRPKSLLLGGICIALGIIPLAQAADHQEAPSASALLAADIGDYYAWHSDTSVNLIVTFGTFAAAGSEASYDPTIIYGFHFDTTMPADGISDLDLYARFAQDESGAWGLQVSGLADDALEGPVETVLNGSGMNAWAGLADDPFFFDQTGFRETISTGVLAFDPNRDDVAGLNVTAIAIEVPTESIVPSGGAFQSWATTGTL